MRVSSAGIDAAEITTDQDATLDAAVAVRDGGAAAGDRAPAGMENRIRGDAGAGISRSPALALPRRNRIIRA